MRNRQGAVGYFLLALATGGDWDIFVDAFSMHSPKLPSNALMEVKIIA